MTPEELRAHHSYFTVDVASRDPETTAWKRRARLQQALWREARGYPIGSQPYRGGANSTPVGSRLQLSFARESGLNFLDDNVRAAVKHRLDHPEPHQTLNTDRLWANLLSSMPLCFNLFGTLAASRRSAARAASAWFPDAPTGDVTLRFEHSPGRLDPNYLGNRSAFDAAFEITGPGNSRGLIGIETKYHEHLKPETVPSATPLDRRSTAVRKGLQARPNAGRGGDTQPERGKAPAQRTSRLDRYIEVTEASGAFAPGWRERLIDTPLQQIWLDHLLVLAALQHPDPALRPTWARFVLVYPPPTQPSPVPPPTTPKPSAPQPPTNHAP